SRLNKSLDTWLGAVDGSKVPKSSEIHVEDAAPDSADGGVTIPVKDCRAIIAPHAGYSYSGPAAAWAYRCIDTTGIKRVFVLGPSHHVYLDGCALSKCDEYETPVGNLPLDKPLLQELANTGAFSEMSLETDEDEHSIEMHLPYIRKIFQNQEITVVPILVGSISTAKEAKFGKILAPYLEDPTNFFVVSSDFCHWGSRFSYTYYETPGSPPTNLSSRTQPASSTPIHASIRALDGEGIQAISYSNANASQGKTAKEAHAQFADYLRQTRNTVCGRHPIGVLLGALAALEADDGFRSECRFTRYEQSSQCVSIPLQTLGNHASNDEISPADRNRVQDDAHRSHEEVDERVIQPTSGLSSTTSSKRDLLSSSDIANGVEVLASDLPPTDRGRGAYLFLLAAAATECSFFGVCYTYGTFLAFHQSTASSPFHQTSAAALSATGALLTGFGFVMPWTIRSIFITKPHWARPALIGSVALNCVSVLAASFLPANSAAGLIFLQGVFPGIATGVAFTPCMLYLPEWFVARRGTATGIVYLGANLGSTVFPLIFNETLSRIGFRHSLRVQALIQLVMGIFVCTFTRPRIPVRKPSPGLSDRREGLRAFLPGAPRALLNPLGLILCAVFIWQNAAWSAVSLYISTLCGDIGLSETISNAVLAAFNAASLFGLLLGGMLADKIPFEALMILSAMGCCIWAYLLLGFANSLGLVLAFVLLFGLTGSGFATAVTPASKMISSRSGAPADFSLIALSFIFVRGVGVTIGPLIASAVYRPGLASDHALWGGHGLQGIVIFVGSTMFGVAGVVVSTFFLKMK
ncbi:hypothetical protein OC845_000821, partial [Tilletia horrida]